jgi:hypothetical protein
MQGKSRVHGSRTCILLPCRYVPLRAVLNVSLGYVALALMCCLPCGYVALRAVLYKVSLGYVAVALVCCLPYG